MLRYLTCLIRGHRWHHRNDEWAQLGIAWFKYCPRCKDCRVAWNSSDPAGRYPIWTDHMEKENK